MSAYREPAAVAPFEPHPPFSYGRWSCPKCGGWRLTNKYHGNLPPEAYTTGTWSPSDSALIRGCYACGFRWLVRAKDAS